MSERQASADDIEITPAMIEAGASVLYRMEPLFASEEFWAKEVYRAMASARHEAPEARPLSAVG